MTQPMTVRAAAPAEPTGEFGTCPIDHAYLSRYTFGNGELEREVLGLFADQAPNYLEQMADAKTDKEWRDAAHTLKGSARAVGALEVAKCAERAELAGRDGDIAARQAALPATRQALEVACRYIRELADKT